MADRATRLLSLAKDVVHKITRRAAAISTVMLSDDAKIPDRGDLCVTWS